MITISRELERARKIARASPFCRAMIFYSVVRLSLAPFISMDCFFPANVCGFIVVGELVYVDAFHSVCC